MIIMKGVIRMLREIRGSIVDLQPITLQSNGLIIYTTRKVHNKCSSDSGVISQKIIADKKETVVENNDSALTSMAIF